MSEVNSTVEYLDIQGFPGYRVGDDGSVWSRRPANGRGPLRESWKRLRPTPDSHGRLFVSLNDNGKQHFIHRLVLEAFVGPCPPGLQGCHKDDDPLNNHLGNLRWDTQKANAEDSVRNGKQIKGIQCHTAKLTEGKVKEIRESSSKGESVTSLAKRFFVAEHSIRCVIKRKTWKHVP